MDWIDDDVMSHFLRIAILHCSSWQAILGIGRVGGLMNEGMSIHQ